MNQLVSKIRAAGRYAFCRDGSELTFHSSWLEHGHYDMRAGMSHPLILRSLSALALLSIVGCGSGGESDDNLGSSGGSNSEGSGGSDSEGSGGSDGANPEGSGGVGDLDSEGSGGNTSNTPNSLNWIIVSGGDVNSPMISHTIEGSDYEGRNGVQCYLDESFPPTNLRIDAEGSDEEGGASVLLQYWNFDTYLRERDESFDPQPPQTETFRLSANVTSGDEFFFFRGQDQTSAHLASGATCHTSFSRIDSIVAGTMVCENLSNDFADANVTIQFSCEAQTY